MTIEINKSRLTLNNVDPFQILILLGDKVDKSTIKNIATPNFSIVVKPSGRPDFMKREGDYTVVVRKDNGEEIELRMPHRGAKMIYVLTLLCQKAVGGLPNKYFTNERAAAAIKALYDKFFRLGGKEWVESCAANNHNISTFRTHAKKAVEDNESMGSVLRYWCGLEDERLTIGKKPLQLRRIRIPNDRIVFVDADHSSITFEQLIEQLPPLEDLFVFKNKTTERICELRIKKTSGILKERSPFNYRIA